MKVIGISSGRKNGYSTRIIEDLLSEIHGETEVIRLSDKKIRGCLGCLKCAADNVCVQKDDFQHVLKKVMEADALVFAGPNYYGSLNAMGIAFWERTFCLRHRDAFALAGKPAIAIGLDRQEKGPATRHIVKMMESNQMKVVDAFSNPGNYQCYDCGFGHECIVGNVYSQLGLCTEDFAQANRPLEYGQDQEVIKTVKELGKVLQEFIGKKEKNDKKISY